ncbi:hypothetical protein COU77_02020 [Candidatus Peregrinibacteria bacterium CG10_big_fil_rev_8_21_14_0_10_49_16]|nr:MAG: hypothetical protein COW95_03185 [Candidatus Peregrinibacteria bacterium CG22_combo_CG10-13_8_21_14_all_49_11]PIR52129.1 MAG: hypothetical protein COU77_02020 [Candidatus Peregrinibacteria bacterium CG10_big_fil_rev_8_21_14_0_10_49_16]
MKTLQASSIVWHDCISPTKDELLGLQKRYKFHLLDIEDCLSVHERPKIEEYSSYIFLVFHIPYMGKGGRLVKEELNIFFGRDFVVTVHDGQVPFMQQLQKQISSSKKKREEYLEQGTAFFVYKLMHDLFFTGFPLVEEMMRDLRLLEETLFQSEEQRGILAAILKLRRNIIIMRSILFPQRSIIALLEHKSRVFSSDDIGMYFDNILDALERQWSVLETAKEMSEALQATHESWLSHKTNSVMRILTVVSVTLLPLTLIASVYGMNIRLPLQQHPSAFSLILAGMFVILTGFLGYFSWKKWL